MEPHNDRPHSEQPESLGQQDSAEPSERTSVEPNLELPTTGTFQTVKGNDNQVVAQAINSTLIHNLKGDFIQNQIIQQPELPRFLSKHQLPPNIADFTGRTQELETILTTLRQENQQSVVAISGMAGSGKSALAIRAAYQLQADFDQVQLYVNLRGTDDHQAVEPANVLVEWLRALGLDDSSIPTTLEERIKTYQTLLRGKRGIILLDNAQNEAQVRPLLPNSSTYAVLITSRKKLVALPGIEFLDLLILREDEALLLLKTLIGASRVDAEPNQAEAILDLCGRLPLAIRIAAGTLNKSSQQHKSLASYADRLRDEKQRLTELHLDYLEENLDIRTSFNLSYRELSSELASLFRWLGLLDAPDFAVGVAAVLNQTDAETTQQQLEHLIDAQLLEPLDNARYRFHDLTRLFAREQLQQAEPVEQQAAAQQRVVQYFLKWSNFMNGCLSPPRRRAIAADWVADHPTWSQEQTERGLEQWALAWFEQERPTLLSLVKWMREAGRWQELCGLSSKLAVFFDRRSYWLEAEQLHRQALHAARQLGNRDEEGASLNNLGAVYQSQGKWSEVVEYHQQSLQISRDLNNRQGEGASLNNLGLVYQSQGKWSEAVECHQQSLQISRDLGDRQGEGQSLNNLGSVYDSQGKWSKAIECHQQSLQISRDLGDRYGEGKSLNNLGNVYQSQGKWSEAIECYQQALQISRDLNNRQGESRALNNLGNVYDSQGKWSEAIECYQQALQICRDLNNRQGEGQSLNNLGSVYQSQGKWSEAIECYQQALQICRDLNNRQGESRALNNLGLVYQSQGKWSEAIEYHQQSLQISRDLGDRQGEGKSLNNLGNVYHSQGKWSEAIECHQQSLQISQDLGDRYGEGKSLNNLGLVYQSQGKWSEAIKCHQQALQISRDLGDRQGEGKSLGNLGLVYKLQKQMDEAIALWRDALTKLHPDSPEYATVTEWLQTASQSRHPTWLNWLLPLGILLFLGWNLVTGHWLIALIGGIGLVGWQWQRKRLGSRAASKKTC